MASSWRDNVWQIGLSQFGASLCARLLVGPIDYGYLTNAESRPGFVWAAKPPEISGLDTYEYFEFGTFGAPHFPYGYPVVPDLH